MSKPRVSSVSLHTPAARGVSRGPARTSRTGNRPPLAPPPGGRGADPHEAAVPEQHSKSPFC